MGDVIAVTGATGQVGGEVVRLLLGDGRAARALVRDPGAPAARALAEAGAELVAADLDRPETLGPALTGCAAAFLSTVNDPAQVARETALVDAAVAAGVPRVVKLSAVGAAPDAPAGLQRWHAAVEEHLAASGLEWTTLRPVTFMQNLLRAADTIRDGALYSDLGAAPVAIVDTRDVALCAALCLVQPGHAGRAYRLTGPEPLTQDEVAARLTAVLGRPVAHVEVTPEQARAGMLAAGLPAWLADDLLALDALFRAGAGAEVSPAHELIAGHPPRPLEAFLVDHAAQFA